MFKKTVTESFTFQVRMPTHIAKVFAYFFVQFGWHDPSSLILPLSQYP